MYCPASGFSTGLSILSIKERAEKLRINSKFVLNIFVVKNKNPYFIHAGLCSEKNTLTSWNRASCP